MKDLEKMNEVERATFLHTFLNAAIPEFLEFTLSLASKIIEDSQAVPNELLHHQFEQIYWHQIVEGVKTAIVLHGETLHRDADLFSRRLFHSGLSIFMHYSMRRYTETETCPMPFAILTIIIASP